MRSIAGIISLLSLSYNANFLATLSSINIAHCQDIGTNEVTEVIQDVALDEVNANTLHEEEALGNKGSDQAVDDIVDDSEHGNEDGESGENGINEHASVAENDENDINDDEVTDEDNEEEIAEAGELDENDIDEEKSDIENEDEVGMDETEDEMTSKNAEEDLGDDVENEEDEEDDTTEVLINNENAQEDLGHDISNEDNEEDNTAEVEVNEEIEAATDEDTIEENNKPADEFSDERASNEADEDSFVEVGIDGKVTQQPATDDYEQYKKETIEKIKAYASTSSKIQKILDKYNELSKRQDAIHNNILQHNKDQLSKFAFPAMNINTADSLVPKQEVLDKYNSTPETTLLNSTLSYYKSNMPSSSTCQQPHDNDLIQLITSRIDQQFHRPLQNDKIRVLYLNSHTTDTYTPKNKLPSYIYHSLNLKTSVPSPSIIFSSYPLHPHTCWPLDGTNGAISFQLPQPLIKFNGISILHSPQDVQSAMYQFKLYDDTNDAILIDDYFDDPSTVNNYIQLFNVSSSNHDQDDIFQDDYDQDETTSDVLQQEFTEPSCSEVTHSCSMPPPPEDNIEQEVNDRKPIQKMTLYFDSNWGNPHYTCVYRLIIHGEYSSD